MPDEIDKTSLADEMATNFLDHAIVQEAAEADRRYMLQRRDQFAERLLIGTLVLNGTSLVALLGVMGTEGATTFLGFTPSIALYSALCFAAGVALAGYSANQRENLYTVEASDAYAYARALSHLRSLSDQRATSESLEQYREAFEEIRKRKPVGFQWSKSSMKARHRAAGLWVAGIIVPLWWKIDAAISPLAEWWPF